MTAAPVRLLRDGDPQTGLGPSNLVDPATFTTEKGSETVHKAFTNAQGNVTAGVWECTPCLENIDRYGVDEICTVLSGSVTVTPEGGAGETFGPGDSFVMPQDFKGTWHITETLRKFWMIVEPPSGAEGWGAPAVRLRPDGRTPQHDLHGRPIACAAGQLEPDETFVDGLIRETREETGVHVFLPQNPEPRHYFLDHGRNNLGCERPMITLSFPSLRLPAILAALLVLFSVPAQAAKDEVYTTLLSDLAVSGYDAVAYFTEGRPVEGSDDFTVDYNGAVWRFASAENREAFAANPAKYAPQYGGYCAWAVSQGYTASTDPEAWSIVDGKLYLNYSKSVQKTWEQDIPGHIAAGDANWPKVLE